MTHLSIDPTYIDFFIKLSVAMLCGVIIGTERNVSHKAAGMRTYALVSMGAALIVIINELFIASFAARGIPFSDTLQIPSMIVSGIGFMGAGMIVFRNSLGVTGLTTASGLWVAAGIGIACGAGFFVPAIMATILTIFILEVLWRVEQRVKKFSAEKLEAEQREFPQ